MLQETCWRLRLHSRRLYLIFPMNFSLNSALVEELVIGYITDTTRAALEIGKPNKITLEDITYVIRKDKRKGKIQLRNHKNIT